MATLPGFTVTSPLAPLTLLSVFLTAFTVKLPVTVSLTVTETVEALLNFNRDEVLNWALAEPDALKMMLSLLATLLPYWSCAVTV